VRGNTDNRPAPSLPSCEGSTLTAVTLTIRTMRPTPSTAAYSPEDATGRPAASRRGRAAQGLPIASALAARRPIEGAEKGAYRRDRR